MIPSQDTQQAFQIIERLAGLCATSGVSEKAKITSNEQIEALLNKIIKPAITELTAKSAGIIH